MRSTKKKSREELIASGFCPVCSKRTRQRIDVPDHMVFECGKCGTILVDVPELDRYVDVTQHWAGITEWYYKRRGEIDNQIYELEMQLLTEMKRLIILVEGLRLPATGSAHLVIN